MVGGNKSKGGISYHPFRRGRGTICGFLVTVGTGDIRFFFLGDFLPHLSTLTLTAFSL